jgi:metal-responsive CopG/Arc/MetJ family transcriptional regulator
MATTIHIPVDLLERLDTRAKVLGQSRNRVILDALRSVLVSRQTWSPELVRMLEEPLDESSAELLDETMAAAIKRRTSRKRAPKL